MIKYIFIFCVLILLFSCGTTNKTKSEDKTIAQTDLLIQQGRMEEADNKLQTLIKLYPLNSEIYRRAGMVKYHLNDKQYAFNLLSRADSLSQGMNPDILFSAGICAFEIGKLKESENFFQRHKLKTNETLKKNKTEEYLNRIHKIKESMKDSSVIRIVPLSSSVNTESDEFLAYPTLDGDNLLFSRRFKSGNLVTEKLMVAKKDAQGTWSQTEEFGIEGLATGSLSGDGKTLVSTNCERLTSIGSCDLIITYLNAGKWSAPKNMTDLINSTEWDAQPSISSDGKMIIFSSSRKGGFGDRDLYYTLKGVNGWQKPINLGSSVNTSASEESPFLHSDNKTLYFRSNHEKGLGSYDIYISRYDEIQKKWGEPVNLGYPINTIADDGALTIAPDGVTSYLTSDRSSLYTRRPQFDIYTFQLPAKFQALPTTYVKVRTSDSTTKKPIRSKVVIEETISSNIVFEGLLDVDGELTIPVNVGTSYNVLITNDKYFPVSRQFVSSQGNVISNPLILDVFLQELNKDVPMIFNNILFETGSAQLKNENNVDLNYLLKLLTDNPLIKIRITGHTDNTGTSVFNQSLSEKRAQSVEAFLVRKGISKERISTEGKGDKNPIGDNSTDEGRRINRRTEVFIL